MTPARSLAVAVIAAALVVAAAALGLTKALGAHPFWSLRIALIGAPLGLALWAAARALRWPTGRQIIVIAALLSVTVAAAILGKRLFAASFAEDRLAGLFWYFGWIGTAAVTTALIAALLAAALNARRES